MKTTLLLVPIKKTEDVNWQKPLNNYLISIYGNTTEFQLDLSNFNRLRQDIRGANADSTGIGLYFRYFSQLELLDLRIPVANVNKHKKLTFTWYDAFLTSSQHKQYALPFEKAGILFNLAALMLKAATRKYRESQNLSGDESAFKEAVQLLQQAAGIFEFIGESFLHAPSNDLNPTTVKFLKSLCLAQSQEIFTLKVIDGDLEQKKNSLIAKLCKSTSIHYEHCFSCCSHLLNSSSSSEEDQSTFAIVEAGLDDDDLESIENDPTNEYNPDRHELPETHVKARIDPFWVAVLQIKLLYYKSLALYFHGLQLENTHKYGDAIAYLSKSLEVINEIPLASLKKVSKSTNDEAYDLLDNLKYHKDALEIKLKELNKDNDLVYHEIVPSLVTLPEIKPMDSSKVIPMSQIEMFARVNEQSYENFLKNVVPMDIHELLSYYSEEKSQFLRNELDEVDVSNEELSSVLEYLKLPKALANIKSILHSDKSISSGSSEQQLDPALLGKVSEISLKYSQDVQNRETIAELRAKIYEIVSRSDAMLKDSPYESSGQLREDLIKLKKALYDAANSDSKLFALVDAEASLLHSILSKGVNSPEFKGLFKVPQNATRGQPSEEISLLDIDDTQISESNYDKQITTLEDILHELNVLKSNKSKLVERLKQEIHQDDISEILMLNSKVKLTNEIKTIIFPEELKKFDVFSQQLNELISRQSALVSQLKEAWTKLTSNPKIKEVQSSKTFQDETLKLQSERINEFYQNSWKRYSIGLEKGAQYYMQLLKMAENLGRAIEANKDRSLTDSMGQMSLGPNSTGGSLASNTFFSQRRDYQPNPPTQAPSSFAQYAPYNQDVTRPDSYAGFRQPSTQLFGNVPQATPSLHASDTGGSATYSRPAPALPPKRPSYVNAEAQNASGLRMGSFSSQPKPQSSSGLIYDEPSTYQPDMYNFFKK